MRNDIEGFVRDKARIFGFLTQHRKNGHELEDPWHCSTVTELSNSFITTINKRIKALRWNNCNYFFLKIKNS